MSTWAASFDFESSQNGTQFGPAAGHRAGDMVLERSGIKMTVQPYTSGSYARDNLVKTLDFETNLSGWGGSFNEGSKFGSVDISSSQNRAGKKSGEFHVTRGFTDGTKRRRVEMRLPGKSDYGVEEWYAWSTYLPDDWVFDTKVSSVMSQWHLNNAAIPAHAPNRPSNIGVPLLFNYLGNNLRIKVNHPRGQKTIYSKSYNDMAGEWTDFVVHVVWSPNNNGLVKVWKNGNQIASYRGATAYDDPTGGPYWQIGVYKPEWKTRPGDTNDVTVYYDEVRAGNFRADYWDVAPSFAELGNAQIANPAGSGFPTSNNPTQALQLRNINARFDVTGVSNGVTNIKIDYADEGGMKNFDINGLGRQELLDLSTLASYPSFDVKVSANTDGTTRFGTIEIRATNGQKIEWIELGGQKLSVDNLIALPEPTCQLFGLTATTILLAMTTRSQRAFAWQRV